MEHVPQSLQHPRGYEQHRVAGDHPPEPDLSGDRQRGPAPARPSEPPATGEVPAVVPVFIRIVTMPLISDRIYRSYRCNVYLQKRTAPRISPGCGSIAEVQNYSKGNGSSHGEPSHSSQTVISIVKFILTGPSMNGGRSKSGSSGLKPFQYISIAGTYSCMPDK